MRMVRSVFARFLLAQVPLFLIFMGLGLHVLSEYKVRDAQQQMGIRIGGLAGRVSSMLEDIEIETNLDAASRLISILMADRGVACVEILRDGKPIKGASAPRLSGCVGAEASQFMEVPLGHDDRLQFQVGISIEEIDLIRRSARDFGWLIVAAGLLLSLLAGALSFRAIVSRPLGRLLASIRSVSSTGAYHPVAVRAKDDIGLLISSFNEMQTHLSHERANTQEALDRLDWLYNSTPALLFTLNSEGVVSSVSQYWLDATGYKRGDVVGRSFVLFLSAESRKTTGHELMALLRSCGQASELPLELVLNDGRSSQMLLSVVCGGSGDAFKSPDFVCVMSDVSQLKTVERELRELALTDFLTKLPNRFGMAERMRQISALPERARGLVAVMLIDLDNFKWVNDTYGHEAGDTLLIEATRRIVEAAGPSYMVARLGGDEFAIVCANLESSEQAQALATRVVNAFASGIVIGDNIAYVGASIGITFASNGALQPDVLLRQADQAMYAAKLEGKNRFAVFSSAHQREEEAKSRCLNLIQNGLEANAFELHYQPIVDLQSLNVIGMEALLRLPSPRGGYEPTEPLIRVAEECGMIERIGHWVLREAAREFSQRQFDDAMPLRLTLNLSTRQLTRGFVDRLSDLLAEFPQLAGRLCLEVTETAAIKRFEVVNDVLARIRACGVKIAIDDFGVGYSSLSYISRLPIDMLKLDRSLVKGLDPLSSSEDECRKSRALVQTTVTLAAQLGVELVAEGIENIGALEELQRLGVPIGQGYMFSPAMPMPQFREWAQHFASSATRALPDRSKPTIATRAA